jgi:hypothetical protein
VQKFDVLKRTLTDFKPSEFAAVTGAAPTPPQPAGDSGQSASEPVPRGRTTLNVSKYRGVIQQAATPPLDVDELDPYKAIADAAKFTAQQIAKEQGIGVAHIATPALNGDTRLEPLTAAAEPEPMTATAPLLDDAELEPMTATAPRTEAAAALDVRTMARPRPPKKAIDPQDSVLVAFRIPKYLKDNFFASCQDSGRTPSLVIRKLMKSFCGM